MSNPRKFGNIILHRVSETMSLTKAKKEAEKIRKTGIRARVDTYQGKYAVWSEKSRGKQTISTSSKPKQSKTKTLYHGTSSKMLPKIKRSGKVVGYWTDDLKWHCKKVHPVEYMFELLIKGTE